MRTAVKLGAVKTAAKRTAARQYVRELIAYFAAELNASAKTKPACSPTSGQQTLVVFKITLKRALFEERVKSVASEKKTPVVQRRESDDSLMTRQSFYVHVY